MDLLLFLFYPSLPLTPQRYERIPPFLSSGEYSNCLLLSLANDFPPATNLPFLRYRAKERFVKYTQKKLGSPFN